MAIKARMVYDGSMDEWSLYLVDMDGYERRILEPTTDGHLESRAMAAGTPNRPVIRLPHHAIWQSIGKALAEHGMVPKAQQDAEQPALKAHLADAQTVRDRLLAIVERP